MAKSASDFGFVECADLITEQHYGRALKFFQLAVSRFLESKSTPKRTEIARQLLHIGAVLEETLKKAYGDSWEQQIATNLLFDDPDGFSAKLEILHDAGVRNVVCWMGVGGVAQEHVLRSMRLFAEEVAPRFR